MEKLAQRFLTEFLTIAQYEMVDVGAKYTSSSFDLVENGKQYAVYNKFTGMFTICDGIDGVNNYKQLALNDYFKAQKVSQPYPSWVYDEQNMVWNPPTPTPLDGKPYAWDETNKKWSILKKGNK